MLCLVLLLCFYDNLNCQVINRVHFYSDVLELDPAPNNGTAGRLYHTLNHPNQLPPIPAPISSAGECPYPVSNADYEDRINSDMPGCICHIDVSNLARGDFFILLLLYLPIGHSVLLPEIQTSLS